MAGAAEDAAAVGLLGTGVAGRGNAVDGPFGCAAFGVFGSKAGGGPGGTYGAFGSPLCKLGWLANNAPKVGNRLVRRLRPPSCFKAFTASVACVTSVVRPSYMLCGVIVVFGGMKPPIAPPMRAPTTPRNAAPARPAFLLREEEVGVSASCWRAVDICCSWALRFGASGVG